MRDTVIERTLSGKLIAIVRGMEESKILPFAEALYDGGVTMIEITFNQARPETFADTAAAIASIRRRFGDRVLAGAGTVMTGEQLELAHQAGAQYIISPHTDTAIIRKTRELGLVSMPGAMTPSECAAAHDAGADFVKLVPAGDLGPGYLKALRAPLSHIKFLAVGGISESNLAAFLAAGAIGFGVGGSLCDKALIDAGEFGKITEIAASYAKALALY
jgi:2-dehydro-3-deoxyphosphogluconate aldolase/(4S)-4-hydroxy-2-oxoglutarate aldolase